MSGPMSFLGRVTAEGFDRSGGLAPCRFSGVTTTGHPCYPP
jgi:hypothetical protein